jgi:hypothetical protein
LFRNFVLIYITQHDQDILELDQHHGAVVVLVVELAELDVVVVVAGVVGLLACIADEFDDLVELAELLLVVVLLAMCHAHLLGNVHAHGVHDVTEVVHVKLALAVPVINVANSLNLLSITLLNEKKLLNKPFIFFTHTSRLIFDFLKKIIETMEKQL